MSEEVIISLDVAEVARLQTQIGSVGILANSATSESGLKAPSYHRSASRCDNPFATCWVRPGELAFQFPPGMTAERLVATLAARNWRGAIVGPHGSGKTTLLETLKPALVAAGCRVHAISLHNGQRRLPNEFLDQALSSCATACDAAIVNGAPNSSARSQAIADAERQAVLLSDRAIPQQPREVAHDCTLLTQLIIVDGYEQLGWFARARLDHFCRRSGAGLLVTAHAPCGIPILIQLAPVLSLVEQLVSQLRAKVSTPITKSHVAASHACHGSNVREVFFALYDHHEHLRRAT